MRHLNEIDSDYNFACARQDRIAEEIERHSVIPDALQKEYDSFSEQMVKLDEERYMSICYWHNEYRKAATQMIVTPKQNDTHTKH